MTDSVIVGVRVRPLNSREINGTRNAVSAWSLDQNAISRKQNNDARNRMSFLYDALFKPDTTNEDVYDTIASPIVESALGGFNATVFAYGQTSSGKTHSMLGVPQDPGITPLAIKHVLRSANASRTRRFLVRVSYVEIYNDRIRDLQNPTHDNLTVREDKAGRVFVDAEESIVETFEDAMAVLEKGQSARQVGETKMNPQSSRSHTVFTLHIESKGAEGVDQSFRASSLNLVDLAGSERIKSTGAEGTRQKEGAHINKSLLVLGTIINRLSSSSADPSKLGHLPYRDSKLTRLLRPALGGNAKTAVLCAVTPSSLHVEETISTLKFAERAKKITTNASRNEIVDYRSKYKEAATELAVLKERCALMETELAEVRGENPSSNESKASESSAGMDAAAAIAATIELQAAREEVKYLKEHVDEVETENEHLRNQLKMKTTEFRGLRSRALELRSGLRKAKMGERTIRKAMVLCYQKLEEAREQLHISRKKGAHVKKAEQHLEDLSENMKSWIPVEAADSLVTAESMTPPGSESLDDGDARSAPRESSASEQSIPERDLGSTESIVTVLSRVPSVRTAAGRRPRPLPLPEDMVADIDDSETEKECVVPVAIDEDDDLEEVDVIEAPTLDRMLRISESVVDFSQREKPKKPKGWKAFKSFYGYGYTERSVYDQLVAGHKVPSTAKHIST